MEERWFKIKRIMLGIKGLDELFKGIYKGSIILLAGNPGTGKTTMAAKFIYEGAKMGEKGIYVSFVETKEDFYRNMKDLGMDFSSLEKEGGFTFMEGITVSSVEALSEFLEEVIREIGEFKADRIAIDSISAVLQMGSQEISKVREMMHNFFYRGAKVRGVTTILIEELPYGEVSVGYGIEEFIVDGVIILKARIVKGKIYRYMEIRKMRGNEVKYGEIPFIIIPGDAVGIIKPEGISEIPSGVYPEKSIKARIEDKEISIPIGSQNLLIFHPMIDPLPVFTWLGLRNFSQYGYKIFCESFTHNKRTVEDRIKLCLDRGGVGSGPEIKIFQINPTAYTLDEIYYLTDLEERKIKPDIAVVNGIEILQELSDPKEYLNIQYNKLLRRMNRKITGFYLIKHPLNKIEKIPLINFYDNVFIFKPYLKGGVRYIGVSPYRIILNIRQRYEVFIKADTLERCEL